MLKIVDNIKASIIMILQIFIKVKYSMRTLNRNVEGILKKTQCKLFKMKSKMSIMKNRVNGR